MKAIEESTLVKLKKKDTPFAQHHEKLDPNPS